MREIPWIPGRAVQPGFGGRQQSEFGAGALAEDGDASIEETLGEGAGMIGDIVLVDAGAVSGAGAGEYIQILQQKRHAGERTVGQSVIDLPFGIIVMLDDYGVDLRIDLRGA